MTPNTRTPRSRDRGVTAGYPSNPAIPRPPYRGAGIVGNGSRNEQP
jgi:hypothetical protein